MHPAVIIGSYALKNFQNRLSSRQGRYEAEIQAMREAHALKMQGKEIERNLDSIRGQTLKQIRSFDTENKQTLDDMRYKYASSGISTSSGSGQKAVQYMLSGASLQRQLIEQAGSSNELELEIALINNRYSKSLNMSKLGATFNRINFNNTQTWLSMGNGMAASILTEYL